MMVIGMCRALYRDKDWTFWRATSSRPRNYVFAENASLITSGTNEKNVIYYSFSYENWNPKYRRHIHNVIVNEMQKFSCLKFNQQTDRERMPPAPALSPVIRLRRLRTRDRCHAKLEDRAMNVYLHEQWCFTPYKIITAFLEALGMHAEKLERPDNVIYQTATLDAIVNHIDPRPEFHHVYATMPRNYEQYAELIAYCYVASNIGLDELRPAIITPITWKNLNEKYCASICPHLKCLNGGMPEVKSCLVCLCPQAYTGLTCETFMHQNGVKAFEMCNVNERKVKTLSNHIFNKYLKYGTTVERQSCQWLLTAPEHRHVYLNFSKYHDFYYNCTKDFVCRDYLEIRIASDLSLDGFRFCCHGPRIGPMYRALISESNKILIISRIQNPGTTGFYAEYMLTPRPLTPLEATLRNRDEQFRKMLRKYIRAKGLDVESMENQLLNHLSKEPTFE